MAARDSRGGRGGVVLETPFGPVRAGRRGGGVGARGRLRLCWWGRRDARIGIPDAAWAQRQPITPAIQELGSAAARTHELVRVALVAELVGLDARIAERFAAVSAVAGRVADSPAERLVEEAEKLGAPASGDDAVARARRAAARARAELAGDRARLDDLRLRLAADLEQRERLIDDAEARVAAISAFRDQCVEVYRAANLRRCEQDAPALAEAWPQPAFAPPDWLRSIRQVPTGGPVPVL